MRFDASALDSVSSNSSPVSRHKVSRYERCASVMGSSPVFHSSGSRCNAGWAVSFVDCFVMGRMDRKTRATASGKTAGASHAPAMGFVEPMLLLRTDALPDSEHWLYELKLDGLSCDCLQAQRNDPFAIAQRQRFKPTLPRRCQRTREAAREYRD
jgi:hypothetical protein